MAVSWGEFPYLENTWERTGLYPRGVIGTKYQFKFNYDLYNYWNLGAKVVLILFISYLLVILEKKKLLDFNLIFVILYLGLMLLSETFYDRYLLVIVPFVLLFLLKNVKINKFNFLLNTGFLLFLSFYTYQFTMDFVTINNYVWNKSTELVNAQNIAPSDIEGNNAWKLNYRNLTHNYLYVFSYDSKKINDDFKINYSLVEEKTIKYPINFFINPKVYLYKKN
jgi:cell division protein FtsW (lipid II flippase)